MANEKSGKSDGGGVSYTFVFLFFIFGGIWGDTALKVRGFISQTERVNLYMKGVWLDGGSRECAGMQAHPDDKPPKVEAVVQRWLTSRHKTIRTTSIRFFGKVSRSDVSFQEELTAQKFRCRCERATDALEGEDFICYALD
ncbi:MAG TPA: hypothetical protein VGD64_02355 [Acidisarcina sp.]